MVKVNNHIDYLRKLTFLGIYTWPDGRRYEGAWIDNKMNGKGIFTWPDGRRYVGDHMNDKKHGRGIFYTYNFCYVIFLIFKVEMVK